MRISPVANLDPDQLAVSECTAMRSVLEQARIVASTRATVLLTGETGVGKGVVARLIHDWSNRKDKPFRALHCGAIPDTLFEGELFGHEKGSFTGAHRRQKGKFELAHRGTLFLDEIGTITHSAQIKLLDVLQGQRFQRVGGEDDIEVDVRIIAASNGDLREMLEQGSFRADLFHRLSVFPIEIPPLRERTDDLPRLAAHLLERLNRFYSKQLRGLHPVVERAFRAYPWPGNIRELENVLERAHIVESTSWICPSSIPSDILDATKTQLVLPLPVASAKTLAEVRSAAVAVAERSYLEKLLATHEGRIDASALAAGITPRQLRKLLAKYEIEKTRFKPQRPVRDRPAGPASHSGETVP